MSKLILYFLAFTVSVQNFAQTRSGKWDQLQNSAHDIGFCVYNSVEKNCKEHVIDTVRMNAIESDDQDDPYFTLSEEWANSRTLKWGEVNHVDAENYLLMFDIRQGYNPTKNEKFKQSLDGFMIINLLDSINFSGRPIDNYVERCEINSVTGKGILECTMWREFMSGRGGRIAKIVRFDILSENNVRNTFKKFITNFQLFKGER
jgi:hypothetical protein